jgi:hypothetical protein
MYAFTGHTESCSRLTNYSGVEQFGAIAAVPSFTLNLPGRSPATGNRRRAVIVSGDASDHGRYSA